MKMQSLPIVNGEDGEGLPTPHGIGSANDVGVVTTVLGALPRRGRPKKASRGKLEQTFKSTRLPV